MAYYQNSDWKGFGLREGKKDFSRKDVEHMLLTSLDRGGSMSTDELLVYAKDNFQGEFGGTVDREEVKSTVLSLDKRGFIQKMEGKWTLTGTGVRYWDALTEKGDYRW